MMTPIFETAKPSSLIRKLKTLLSRPLPSINSNVAKNSATNRDTTLNMIVSQFTQSFSFGSSIDDMPKSEAETGSLFLPFGLDPDPPAMRIDNPFDNG